MNKPKFRLFIFIALCIAASCIFSGESLAASLVQRRQAILEPLFDGPCAKYSVPKPLAMAIARQESGMQPWIINIAGTDIRPGSREEALEIARAAYRAGRSFDVGLMQINVYWIKTYKLPLEVVVDPQANVQIGVWILAKQIQQHGFNWKAIAYYHTPMHRSQTHLARGYNYASSVIGHLRKIMAEAESG